MTTTTDRPIYVDGVRLDSLAWNVTKINRATAARRPNDIPLPGADGVRPSVNDSIDAVPFGLEMFVRGTDEDGVVPSGGTRDAFRANLDELVHLFGKRYDLLEVTEQVTGAADAATSAALAEWVERQSRLGSQTLNILIGPSDSITEGYNVDWQKNWTYLFADEIAARLGQTRRGYYIDAQDNGPNSEPWPITFSGTTATDTNFGLGRQATQLGALGKATLTVQAGEIDILWTESTAAATGSFRWRVDGGAWSANINTGTGGSTQCGRRTNVPGLDPDTSHVLEVEYVSGNPVILEGFMVYDDEKALCPVRIWEGGLPGAQAQAYADPAAPWWRTAVVNNMAGETGLCILPIGWNDYNNGRTKAQIKTDIQTIITNLRADTSQPGLSILLVGYWEPTAVGVGGGATFAQLLEAYQEIADEEDVAFLDFSSIFGAPASARRASLTLGGGDNVHPNETGYRLMADTILATVVSVIESAERRALAKVVDTIAPDINEPGSAAVFTVGLTIPSGLWEDAEPSDWTTGMQPGTPYPDDVPLEIHTLRGSTERITDAIVVVKGPATSPTVKDPTTGAFVTLLQDLGAGDYWRINCGTWVSRFSDTPLTASSPDTLGTDMSGLTFAGGSPGQSCWLPLTPVRNADGTRSVYISLSGDTDMTSDTQLLVRARRKFAL